MKVTLFHFQGSPNCAAARLACQHKGADLREVELPIGLHAGIVRTLGFRRGTVPAARIEGRRVQGSSQIMRALEPIAADPPLFTTRAVEEAERWGEEVLQTIPRRILGKLVRRAPDSAASFMPGGAVGRLPRSLVTATSGPTLRFQLWRLRAGRDLELKAALSELPGALSRVAALLDDGVLSAEAPTAADFQIAPQLRCLMCTDDLRPVIERHGRVAAWARAIVPHYPGRVPRVLQEHELEALGA